MPELSGKTYALPDGPLYQKTVAWVPRFQTAPPTVALLDRRLQLS